MKRLMGTLLLLAVWLGSGTAAAQTRAEVRRQVESSVLVSGTIDINADGQVAGYTLENRDRLPAGIVALIERTVPGWRFEPVALPVGKALARSPMGLRLVAKRLENDNYAVDIRSAQFGDAGAPEETVRANGKLKPPVYPDNVAYAGAGGTVYAVLRIGRDGRVEEAVVEQVNLRVIATEPVMKDLRDALSRAVLRTAKHWTFIPPVRGDDADAPHWSVRVPVDFIAPGAKDVGPGQWQAYVPGPRQPVPWVSESDQGGADAVAAGGVYPLGRGPRLLSALDAG